MGLDIMFYKTTPSKGVDATNIDDLYEDMEKRYEKNYNEKVDKLLNDVLQSISIQERMDAIAKLYNFTKEMHNGCEWYYDKITNDATNEELAKIVESNKNSAYRDEDVYFRKANYVYAYFAPYLEDEQCFVTKDMVNGLLEKCHKVLDAAYEDGWVDKKGNLVKEIMEMSDYHLYEKLKEYTDSLPNGWMKVADEVLPTQAGFFFGSTEYDYWYLYSVKNCINQFTKLLNTWKENEQVFCIMSW